MIIVIMPLKNAKNVDSESTHGAISPKTQQAHDEKFDHNTTDTIDVKINSQTKSYSSHVVKQSPFFKVRLSHRWDTQSKSDIDINAPVTNDEAKMQHQTQSKVIDIGNKMPFTLDTLDALFTVLQTKTLCPEFPLSNLKSLLQCELYLGLDIIDQNMVNGYFELSFFFV